MELKPPQINSEEKAVANHQSLPLLSMTVLITPFWVNPIRGETQLQARR